MNNFTKPLIFLLALTIVSLIGSWILSEIRWAMINNPTGKFTNAVGYLEQGRPPREVTSLEIDGKPYWIAYGMLDTWMATPSGSSAYVFDQSGKLVDWTRDIGDDSSFQIRWTGKAAGSSIEELSALAK